MAPLNAISINSEIEIIKSSVLITLFYKKNSTLVNTKDISPRCEILTDSPLCEKSNYNNAVATREKKNLNLENLKLITS